MEYQWQFDLLLIILCAIALPVGLRLGSLIWSFMQRRKKG